MFDRKRFGRLLAVYWAERRREHLWFLAAFVAAHICLWLLFTMAGSELTSYTKSTAGGFYFVGFSITTLLVAGLHFSPLSRRGSALTWLMRPASTAEKFTLAFLVVAVLFPLAYTLVFQLWHLPAAWMAQIKTIPLEQGGTGYYGQPPELVFLPFSNREYWRDEASFFLTLNTLQALVATCMLRFRSFPWLKTLLILFLFVVVAVPLLSSLSPGDIDMLLPSTRLPDDAGLLHLWRWILWLGVPGLLWNSAYFYMRDRELH